MVRGDKGAPGLVGGVRRAARVPDIHTVRRGDTLWDLCDYYFASPWSWPRIWSYNPQVQNPHWIYPGDQLRMRHGAQPGSAAYDGQRPAISSGTVFLRSQGYIDNPKRDVWGELVGSREQQMLLSEGNNVYLLIKKGRRVRPGQRLTVFRPVRRPIKVKGARKPPGQVVAIQGTVQIERFDPKSRIARGKLVESVDVIERGASIGPVGRRFHIVPPRTSQVNLKARVLTGIYPHVYLAQNQVVFIDRGKEDGLRAGNRLFVVARGDAWRRTLKTTKRMARSRARMRSDKRVDFEDTPLRGDEKKFPQEIIAELRVLSARKYSSITMVTVSHREVVPGDVAIARRGM